MWIFAVVVWIVLSILAGVGAKNKGRSFAGYFFLSLLLSPLIGLIAMAVIKPIEKKEEEKISQPEPASGPVIASPDSNMIACSNCGQSKKRGGMCPHCGSWQS